MNITEVADDFYASAGKFPPAEIFLKIEDDVQRSFEENRPIKKEVEFIRIFADPGSIQEREITEQDKINYRGLYQRFSQTKLPTTVDGTALSDLPWMTRARAEEFAAVKLFTAEQAITAREDQIIKLGMGAREEIAKIKAFLKMAKDTKLVTKQAQTIEAQNKQIEKLQEELKALSDAVREMNSKKG
jgi:hypothetical protein